MTVTILDVNDNAPNFLKDGYTKSVNEDVKDFSEQDDNALLTVSADDGDEGINSEVVYTIESGNEEGKMPGRIKWLEYDVCIYECNIASVISRRHEFEKLDHITKKTDCIFVWKEKKRQYVITLVTCGLKLAEFHCCSPSDTMLNLKTE